MNEKVFSIEQVIRTLKRSPRLALAIALLLAVFISRIDWHGTPAQISGRAEVRDGDSLVIAGSRVRLKGIDAPERAQKCKRTGRDWPCGKAAERHLAGLIGSKGVTCRIAERDRFNRLLAYCRAGARDLNRSMVRDGFAVRFGRAYAAEEAEAQARRRGIWAGTFTAPRKWRAQNPRS